MIYVIIMLIVCFAYYVFSKAIGYNPNAQKAKAFLKAIDAEKAREFSSVAFDEYMNDKVWDDLLSEDEIEAMR